MRNSYKKLQGSLLFAGFLLFACSFITQAPVLVQDYSRSAIENEQESVSNGERIYFTATSGRGDRISFTGGPISGGMMMGSYLTCASCHGPAARGGLHQMHMQVMDAPDIRYIALSGEANEHADEGESHDDEHAEYDLDDFYHAVIEGQHPDGEHLNTDMPRWQMSDEDLSDLYAFLKALP